MVALLVTLTIMGIMLSVALPAWQTLARREKEAELIFRGQQYARAIALFQRKYVNASPPTLDILVTEHFLRKKFADPITAGEFEVLTPTSAIQGSTTPAPLQGGRAGTAATQGRAGGLSPTSNVGRTGGTAAGGRATQPQTTTGRASTGSGAASFSSFSVGGNQTGGATLGIIGVRSKSKEKSLRLYNGADTYDQWIFLATQATTAVTSPAGGAAVGGGSGRGQPPGAGARGGRAPGAGTLGQPQGQPQGQRGRGAPTPAPRGAGAGGAGGGFGGGGAGGRGR